MKNLEQYPSVVLNNFCKIVPNTTHETTEYKKKLIKSIMVARHKLAEHHDRIQYGFDKAKFERLCKMDVDELELLNMEHIDIVKRLIPQKYE